MRRGGVSRNILVTMGIVAVCCVGAAVAIAAFHDDSTGATATGPTGIDAYKDCLTQHGVTEEVPSGETPSDAQIKAFTECRPALGLDQNNNGGFSSTRLAYYECIYEAGMKAQADGKATEGSEYDSEVTAAVQKCRDEFGYGLRGQRPSGPQTTTTTPTY
jgi:hypothetical protein